MRLGGLAPGAGWQGSARSGLMISLVSAALLLVLVAGSDWRGMLASLSEARLEWLAAAVGLVLGVEVAKGARWWLLLGLEPGRLPRVLGLVLGARLLNTLAPLRAGDLWRVVHVSALEGRHPLTAGGSVLVEKGLDGLLLGLVGLALLGGSGDGLLVAAAALAAALGGTGLVVLSARRWNRVHRLVDRALVEAGQLRRRGTLLQVSALSVCGIGLGLAANLAVLHAMSLPVTFALGAAMLLAGYAVALVPAGPGQIGIYELAVAAPLAGLGLEVPDAVAAALALHLVMLINVALGGALAVPLGARGRTSLSSSAERLPGP